MKKPRSEIQVLAWAAGVVADSLTAERLTAERFNAERLAAKGLTADGLAAERPTAKRHVSGRRHANRGEPPSGSPALQSTLKRLQAIGRIAAAYRASGYAGPLRSGDSAPETNRGMVPEPSTLMPDTPLDLPPLFLWGPLRVLEKLGEGSYGEIFRAFDPNLRREVALKLRRRSQAPVGLEGPDDDFAQGLEEARRLARVRHPNVLSVHGAAVHEGRVGIWTDLVRGNTLEERLRREGPLGAPEAALIGLDLCRALAAVHQQGLVHGDVKAANVMREEGGNIVLLDFSSGRDLHREVGPAAGTPLAMAPEGLRGDPIGPPADLYSLGVLLYRLSTGRYPVPASNLAELLARHSKGDVIPLRDVRPDIPLAFVRVVEHALAPLERRYATAGRMERELADALLQIKLGTIAPIGEVEAAGARAALHNLPAALTSFVGRERELAEVAGLLSRRRLVTLTGMGGAGKTRLALEVGSRVLDAHADGVWLVELAALNDPSNVPHAIAKALGVREAHRDGESPKGGLEEVLAEYLGRRELLLVLDNCEHLPAAAGLAGDLLRRAPRLRVLATSREPLGITGESIFQVPPLQIPPEAELPLDALALVESVRLFVERSSAVNSAFDLDSENSRGVARICQQLDGIPLALELAAAHVRTLPVEEVARRIGDRFEFLTRGDPSALPRHRTLRALIDWSHEQLSRSERALLRRLAIFSGGWSLEAAEAICPGTEIAPDEVVGLLSNLAGKSLVERDGRARYRMLETVREYALEQALDAGEQEEVLGRHRDHFLRFAEEAEPHLTGPDQETWFSRLDADGANLRAAVDSFLGPGGDPPSGARLAAALGRYYLMRGHWHEGRRLCQSILSGPAVTDRAETRARILTLAGDLAYRQGDGAEAEPRFEEALTIRRDLSDLAGMATSLGRLGNLALMGGEYPRARKLFDEALDIQRRGGDPPSIVSGLLNLGRVACLQGSYDEAKSAFTEGLQIARGAGHTWGILASLNNLAGVELNLGDFAAALSHQEECLEVSRRLGDRRGVSATLYNLGNTVNLMGRPELSLRYYEEALRISRELGETDTQIRNLQSMAGVAQDAGDLDRSRELLEESLELAWNAGDVKLAILALASIGVILVETGDALRGLRLLAAAESRREGIGAALREDQRRHWEAGIDAARRRVGEFVANTEWAAWRNAPLEKAVELARGALPKGREGDAG